MFYRCEKFNLGLQLRIVPITDSSENLFISNHHLVNKMSKVQGDIFKCLVLSNSLKLKEKQQILT